MYKWKSLGENIVRYKTGIECIAFKYVCFDEITYKNISTLNIFSCYFIKKNILIQIFK